MSEDDGKQVKFVSSCDQLIDFIAHHPGANALA